MVTDGALGSRTAAMLAPYSDDPSTSGMMTIETEKLKPMAIERDRAGLSAGLSRHRRQGQSKFALDVFEVGASAMNPREIAVTASSTRRSLRRMTFARFGQLNVIASMQPSHETNDMRWAEQRVGPERVKGAYAWNSLQKAGAKLAFGTDYDVEPINPFRGIYACVTRELPDGGPAGGWEPQEKLPLDECLRAYTYGSAYAEFEEGKKGELKVGQYADFVVLSTDLTKATPKEILKTEVLRTVVGGRVVYQKN